MIHDEDDLRRHVDYIHFNPVKHGLAARAADWKWSTFRRHVKDGVYPPDWGLIPEESFAASRHETPRRCPAGTGERLAPGLTL